MTRRPIDLRVLLVFGLLASASIPVMILVPARAAAPEVVDQDASAHKARVGDSVFFTVSPRQGVDEPYYERPAVVVELSDEYPGFDVVHLVAFGVEGGTTSVLPAESYKFVPRGVRGQLDSWRPLRRGQR